MITKQSRSGVAETVSALVAAVESRQLVVFAQIDHAAAASDAGLELDDEQVLLFGNPRSGTPLMQDDHRIGIELPLRVLVWREDNEVRLGYNDPREMADRYDVEPHRATLDQMATLLDAVTDAAAAA